MDAKKFETHARNWFIAIVAGFAFCMATSSDIDDAQLIEEAKVEAQQNAARDAIVKRKAESIAEQMIAQGAKP